MDRPMRCTPDPAVPVLRADLSFTVVDDHLVLHDAGAHRTHVLNASSARIWAAVDGHRTVRDIAVRLAQETGTALDVVEPDVVRAIERFAELAIVESAPLPHLTGHDASAPVPAAPGGKVDPSRSTGSEPAWCASTGSRRALGATFRVRTDDARLAGRLDAVFDSFEPASHAERALHTFDIVRSPQRFDVVVDGTLLAAGFDVDDAVAVVLAEVNRLAVTETEGRLLLHAGAVERDGTVVVIVGPSGHGKSTLTAALTLAGFAYLTDEVVAVDPATGRVQPYLKPLSVSAATARLLGFADKLGLTDADRLDATDMGPTGAPARKHPLAPTGLGTTSAGGHVGLVVLLEGPSKHPPPDAGDLPDRVTGFLALLEQVFAETMVVPDALDHLGALYSRTPVLRLGRDAPGAMVRAVTAALRR